MEDTLNIHKLEISKKCSNLDLKVWQKTDGVKRKKANNKYT